MKTYNQKGGIQTGPTQSSRNQHRFLLVQHQTEPPSRQNSHGDGSPFVASSVEVLRWWSADSYTSACALVLRRSTEVINMQ